MAMRPAGAKEAGQIRCQLGNQYGHAVLGPVVDAVLGPVDAVLSPVVDAVLGPVDAVLGPVDAVLGPVDAVLGPVVESVLGRVDAVWARLDQVGPGGLVTVPVVGVFWISPQCALHERLLPLVCNIPLAARRPRDHVCCRYVADFFQQCSCHRGWGRL
jgi:hypothetical protein